MKLAVAKASSKASSKATLADEARQKERREQMAKIKARITALEANQKGLTARMAKSAEKITPEMQQKMTDGFMSSREPYYLDLFYSWNLDPGTRKQVLEIIREREVRGNAGVVESMKSGNMVEGKKQRDRLVNEAEGQLFFLLGQDRLEQIALVDKQMQDEALARIDERSKNRGAPK
jgi:hypothetical protein